MLVLDAGMLELGGLLVNERKRNEVFNRFLPMKLQARPLLSPIFGKCIFFLNKLYICIIQKYLSDFALKGFYTVNHFHHPYSSLALPLAGLCIMYIIFYGCNCPCQLKILKYFSTEKNYTRHCHPNLSQLKCCNFSLFSVFFFLLDSFFLCHTFYIFDKAAVI